MTNAVHNGSTMAGQLDEAAEDKLPKPEPRRRSLRKLAATLGVVAGTAAVLAGGYVGYLYASTPVTVRQPLLEHYHFRMQILVNGKAENFAEDKYQTGYSKDNCHVGLPDHPFHFHDKKDQFAHVHWEGMTGGQLLKYYGWNFIGGTKGSLGYRFDTLGKAYRLGKVPIHGNILPAIPNDANFYVYVRDGENYKEKKFDDFTHQDLEKFFGVASNFPAHKLNQDVRKSSFIDHLDDRLFPKAYAHDGVGHSEPGTGAAHFAADTAELTRINNLIGDVVIFVQKNKPADAQIKGRFDKLEPLSDSTCGG